MTKIVLIRHGESLWNKENRFTGWYDVELSEKGIEEAKAGGEILKNEGYTFDLAYTSVLTRAIKTLNLVLESMDLNWIPVIKSWKLNERHYGALQGLDKSETAARHGEDQVKIWRRAYDIAPPPLKKDDERWAGKDPRYTGLSESDIPLTECLKDAVERVVPYWTGEIVPQLKTGKKIIIAAHGNSLRALVKHLDQISDDEIVNLNIPTAVPLVYELDDNLKPIKHYYLGDQEAIAAKAAAVAAQGSAK